MKKLIYVLVVVIVSVGFLSCATQTTVAEKSAEQELPESVQKQSRKDLKESEGWENFDKSGPVKFLQVQGTAAGSPEGSGAKLDGSVGEKLVEIKTAPDVACENVVWTLANKGPSSVWVVAGVKEAVEVAAEGEATVETPLVDGYCYIVVDNEGGGKTELGIKATCGETEAKTVRGKDMKVLWF